jgi:phosphatidylglycerol:prolipoprotein diacylglycerol transferase
MHPTLFTIGNLSIPTYTVLLDLGLILGLVLTYFEGKRVLGSGETALDLGLLAVIGGILGGRLGFVLANWSVFSQEPGRIVRIWEGGLSFHGAFLGGLLVLVLFALLRRQETEPSEQGTRPRLWTLGDVVTPGLVVGIAFGWAACYMGGCAYGRVGEGFGYLIQPDLFGVEAPRFATQAVGFGYALLLFAGIWLLRGRWPFRGAAFLMFNLLYFAGQFLLEFTRGDEAIYFGPWRLAQALDLALALVAAAGLMVLWWRARGEVEEEPEAAEEPEPVAEIAPLPVETEDMADAEALEVAEMDSSESITE